MDTTKVLIGTAVGAVANFMGGWLIYGMLMPSVAADSYVAGSQKTDPNMLGILASTITFSLLLAYIYERWAGIRTLKSGAIAGAIIGGLMTLSFDINLFSMANYFTSATGVILDVIANTALCTLTGAAIGWYLGYNRKA
jgi:hypothetical protein